MVRVPDCRSGGCGFESRRPRCLRPASRGCPGHSLQCPLGSGLGLHKPQPTNLSEHAGARFPRGPGARSGVYDHLPPPCLSTEIALGPAPGPRSQPLPSALGSVPTGALSSAQVAIHRGVSGLLRQRPGAASSRVGPSSFLALRPACGRGRRRFPSRGRPACPPAPRSRSRCANGRGCSARRNRSRSATRLPARSACQAAGGPCGPIRPATAFYAAE